MKSKSLSLRYVFLLFIFLLISIMFTEKLFKTIHAIWTSQENSKKNGRKFFRGPVN